MKIVKTREVKTPIRGDSESAGIDFFVPKFNSNFLKDLKLKNNNIVLIYDDSYNIEKLLHNEIYVDVNNNKIILPPQQSILIPSGIHVNFYNEEKYLLHTLGVTNKTKISLSLNAYNKSGISSKRGLDKLAEVVDINYTGEIHIGIVNTSNNMAIIKEDDKLIQFLLQPIILTDIEDITHLGLDELYKNVNSERGDGAFGSTDKKL